METNMNRISISEVDELSGEKTLLGWFDHDRAERFPEATEFDGENHISVATGSQFAHEAVLRTAQGRWVLNAWSDYRGSPDVYSFIDEDRARDWLIANGENEAVVKYFGEPEEEKGPGRPEIGDAIKIRLGDTLLAKVDAARADGESRAAAIRRLLSAALT